MTICADWSGRRLQTLFQTVRYVVVWTYLVIPAAATMDSGYEPIEYQPRDISPSKIADIAFDAKIGDTALFFSPSFKLHGDHGRDVGLPEEFLAYGPKSLSMAKKSSASKMSVGDELAWDLGQATLDIVGIFEPTPFADTSNAGISLYRGQWVDAGISAVGVIPYAGDLAKLAKLRKIPQLINRAIDLSKTSTSVAKSVHPRLREISNAIGRIPDNKLPDSIKPITRPLKSCKTKIDDYLNSPSAKLSEAGYPGVKTINNCPSFSGSDFIYKLPSGKPAATNILLTGSREKDRKAAQAALGMSKTPDGYVWHHVADYNPKTGKGTLELVPIRPHQLLNHRGGVSQYTEHTNTTYK